MEKLFLKSWEYNSYLIINKLSEIVEKNGGEIISEWKEKIEPFEIVNRTILEVVAENKKTLETIEKNQKSEEIKNNAFYQKIFNQLKEFENINNEPKKIYFKNYITFFYGGFVYYLQLDSNPFFEDYIIKKRCESANNEEFITTYHYYMETFSKKWFENYEGIESYSNNLMENQIEELASRLWGQLIAASPSKVVVNKQRVPNTYNDSYHFEGIKEIRKTIYKKIIKE